MTELTLNQIEALRIYATTAGKPIKDVSAFELLMAAKAEQHFKNGFLDPKVLETLCTLATKALNPAPWEIEKWLITIKAHCTVIADSGGEAKECADRIKQNIDDELRPALLAEVARLTAVIEHDRSKVVEVLAEANAVLKNYGWLAEGRGSYAFDDDRWKDEFKVCMDSLAGSVSVCRKEKPRPFLTGAKFVRPRPLTG